MTAKKAHKDSILKAVMGAKQSPGLHTDDLIEMLEEVVEEIQADVTAMKEDQAAKGSD